MRRSSDIVTDSAVPLSARSNVLPTSYVFSGARPSSGAASSACSNALDFCRHATCFGRAAPEDWRAPLNRYNVDSTLL